MLSRDIERNGEIAWKSDGSSISTFKKTKDKNNINYVRYTFLKKGQLFNQQPEKAPKAENDLIPRKKNLPTRDYGGYNDASASFFTLVKHTIKGKPCISIKPVDLLVADQFINDDAFALEYCKTSLDLENQSFSQQERFLKLIRYYLLMASEQTLRQNLIKRTLVLSSSIPLILSPQEEKYIKRLSSVIEKAKRNRQTLKIDEEYDKITKDENRNLYKILKEKCKTNVYKGISF